MKNKNLFLVHNIEDSGVTFASEIGGLPSPSLAVIDGETPFTKYGSITLVKNIKDFDFNKHPAHVGDIYSVRMPQCHFKANNDVLDEFCLNIKALIPEEEFNKSHKQLNRYLIDKSYDGEEYIYERFMKDSPLVKLAYLRTTGRDVEFTYKNKTTPYGLSQYKPFLDELVEFEFPEGALDQQDIRKLSDIVLRNIEGFVKQRAEEPSGKVLIKTIYGGKQSKFESKIRFRLTESGDEGRVVPERDIKKLRELRQELVSPAQEMDYNAFHDKVNEASKGDHGLIAQWVTKQISHAFHSPYFNSEDRFANTIKKSYTAKNIVKEMNKEGANSDTIGMQSAGAVRAATARKLNNVASIKSAAGYLDNPENNKDSHDSLDDRLFELTSEIFKLNPNSTNYTEQTIINEVIVEYAATKNIASLQSLSYLKDLSPNDAIVKKIDQFIADVSASKTDYFEVKPKRVVGFSEFDTAIIPTIANPKAKQILIDAGLNIIEYDYDNDNGRKEVLLTIAKDLAATIEYESNELTP